MAKILLRILDKTILPAATLVVFKVFGMYLITNIMDYSWYIRSFSTSGSIFSVRFIFESSDIALIVNTFSNSLMYFITLIVCALIILRAYYFHSSHQSPKIIAKLANVNMLGLIADTEDIITDAFVWFTALWIATIICIYGGLTDTSFIWIAPASFICSLVASAVLISDLEKEIGTNTNTKISQRNY